MDSPTVYGFFLGMVLYMVLFGSRPKRPAKRHAPYGHAEMAQLPFDIPIPRYNDR